MVSRKLVLATLGSIAFLTAGSATSAIAGAFSSPAFTAGASFTGALSLASAGESADFLQGAEDFISDTARRGITFLSDENLTEDQRKKEFRTLLQDSFDMDTIGRFSLGRYWRVATPEEQKRYLGLFRDMVVDVYSSRFSEYKGEKVEVRSSRAEGKSDVLVTSFIVPDGSGPEIQVDWRVRYKNNRYKVIDVIVEGVSMGVTQRSDFASVIQRGGGKIEVLLAHLEQQDSL